MAKAINLATYQTKSKVRRPGVHSKTKSSGLKSSKNYRKVWIQRNDEIILWKEFSSYVPVSIEYNINF